MKFDFRWLFVGFCVAGMVAIASAAFFEFSRQQRGSASIAPRHFRWRMFSAALWLLILGSLAYATIFYWPSGPKDVQNAQRFLSLTGGAMALLFIALFLMFIDFKMTLTAQQEQRRKFQRNLSDMAEAEIQRQMKKQRLTQQNGEGKQP